MFAKTWAESGSGLVFIFAQNFISLYRKALEVRPGPQEAGPEFLGPEGSRASSRLVGRRAIFSKKTRPKNRGVTCLKPESSVFETEKFALFWPLVYIQKSDQTQIFAGLAASHTAFVFQIREKYIQILGGLYTNFGRFIYKFWAVYIQISGGLYTNFGRSRVFFVNCHTFFRGQPAFCVALAQRWLPSVSGPPPPAIASSGFCFSSRF